MNCVSIEFPGPAKNLHENLVASSSCLSPVALIKSSFSCSKESSSAGEQGVLRVVLDSWVSYGDQQRWRKEEPDQMGRL